MYALSPDDPGRSLHVVVENRYLHGPLDQAALRLAFGDVTRRHDGLRLALDVVAPDARVRIEEAIDPPVEHLDLSGLGEHRQRVAVAELAFHENRRCFDLRGGPVWHAWVVRLGPEKHLLNACFSHIIADGWAPKAFVDDLMRAYGARLGQAPPLPDDALTFAEIHALQSSRLEARPERVRYWRDRLRPRPPDPEMIAQLRASPDADLMARTRIQFWFPPETYTELRRVAWRARTTTWVAQLAGYHLLTALANGTDRSVINMAMGSRVTDREKRSVFQFAVDPYVCTEVPAGGTLLDMVRATTGALSGAADNAMSYNSIARAVNPRFDEERPWPAFNFCDGAFIDTAFFDQKLSVAGIEVEQTYIPGEPPGAHGAELVASRLPDAVAPAWAARSGPGILIYPGRKGGKLRYNGQVHSDASMRQLLDGYLWVVEALARRPDMRIDELRDQYAARARAGGG
jgi:hypothetical protein